MRGIGFKEGTLTAKFKVCCSTTHQQVLISETLIVSPTTTPTHTSPACPHQVLLGFYQVWTVLGEVYGVTLPSNYTGWLNAFRWLNVGSDIILPPRCIGSAERERGAVRDNDEGELHGAHKAKTRSSVSEFNPRAGEKADRREEKAEEEEEVIPWERVLRQTHPSDLVLSAYNPLSSLCLLANVTGVPIPWEQYHQTKPALPDAVGSLAWQAGLAKPQHVPGNEGVLLGLTDKEIAALLEKNSQEVYTVARLHDRFEAVSYTHLTLPTIYSV